MKLNLKTLSALLFLLWMCVSVAPAQMLSNVDLDQVKQEINNPDGDYYYPKLLEAYLSQDSELRIDEFYHLYYGQSFQEDYNPYGEPDAMEKFNKYIDKDKFSKALEMGEDLLRQAPFDTKLLSKLYYCAKKTGNKRLEDYYGYRVYGILDVIEASGDGKSKETAFVVARVPDEYSLLSYLGLQFSGQSLVDGCDLMSVKTPNDFGQGEVWFNIELPWATLSKMFEGK